MNKLHRNLDRFGNALGGFFSFRDLYVAKGLLRIFHLITQLGNIFLFLMFLFNRSEAYFYTASIGFSTRGGIFFFIAILLTTRASFELIYIAFSIGEDIRAIKKHVVK